MWWRLPQIVVFLAWLAIWLYLCIILSPSGKRFTDLSASYEKRVRWIFVYTFIVMNPIMTCLASVCPFFFQDATVGVGLGMLVLSVNTAMVITAAVFSTAVFSKTERDIIAGYTALSLVLVMAVAYSFFYQ